MEFLHKYKVEHHQDGATLILYVSDFDTEFATELGTEVTNTRQEEISSYAQRRFPSLKINTIKIVAGGIIVCMFSFSGISSKTTAKAAEPNQTVTTALSYTVKSGDSISVIAKRYNITTNELKSFNKLTTDTIKVGQVLQLPLTKYTVKSGDSLSVIAKAYSVSVERLKALNNMNSDVIFPGQALYVPTNISTTSEDTASNAISTTISTYTIQAGDSLSVLAKRFGTTVAAIKAENNLTTDIITIGQKINIPGQQHVESQKETQPTDPLPDLYTVGSGDSLSVIAKKFNTTVQELMSLNLLTNSTIIVGQTLKISNPTTNEENPVNNNVSAPTSYTVVAGDTLSGIAKRYGLTVSYLKEVNNLHTDTIFLGQKLQLKEQQSQQTYTVKSGDSLSQIAKNFGVTTSDIMSLNSLKSELIFVGQTLLIKGSGQPNTSSTPIQKIENTVSYRTHTVVSGDNIWNLSVKYGIPQAELLRVNKLTTSSRLSIGQKLTIPVHQIAVQETVSERHGEYLDWWTEAQYVFPIGKTVTITDFQTGKSFKIKRTIGANHADCETVTTADTTIAKGIWGGFSWSTRAVLVEVDGRKIAASMSFAPHDVDYISNNGLTGHFDIHFKNSTRHKDGQIDSSHQDKVKIAAGLK
ncbi:LysM repeat protein [Metabacillus crassostreae]|uniref:LysM peptidoglycan-binding domain-containing protein n=1 Tax=Metabacillus crassostreae TaxID=929098 RepID=UPI00195EEECC|nr:LysM repeat protein [Metabacillus crassostreae]